LLGPDIKVSDPCFSVRRSHTRCENT
jgi:hypothetical protein